MNFILKEDNQTKNIPERKKIIRLFGASKFRYLNEVPKVGA